MNNSIETAESILTIDLGSVNTRAAFFDIVDGSYALVAAATTPATFNAPFRDVTTSLLNALENLTEITGRKFVEDGRSLIHPSTPDGSGVDLLVMTFSGGPELRILSAGLGESSLVGAQNLAATSNGRIVESISPGDHRTPEEQIRVIVNADPDLILLNGGTDRGASRSVYKIAELVYLACRLMPENGRPVVFYTGNQRLAGRISEVLGRLTVVKTASNLQPEIGVDNVSAALEPYGEVLRDIQSRRLGGFGKLATVCGVPPQPSEHAMARMVRFLSRIYAADKGVLGIDIGAAHTTMAAGVGGDLTLNVLPIGLGTSLPRLLDEEPAEEIVRWLPMRMSADELRDYFWQKSLYPALVPATPEALALEQAAARALLGTAFTALRKRKSDLPQAFEPVIASGPVFTRAANPVQALLTLIDGLQPVGVTNFLLDLHSLLPGIGAAAKVNPALAVQVLESGAFLNLGTVISPVSSQHPGAKVMRARLETQQGDGFNFDVIQGAIMRLPLQHGQPATLHLDPVRGIRFGSYGKRSQTIKITGGICGAIIDARGRPLKLPADDSRRVELLAKWQKDLEQN